MLRDWTLSTIRVLGGKAIRISAIRTAAVGWSSEHVDAALLSLQAEGHIRLLRNDNPLDVREGDTLMVNGFTRHLVYLT
jgi:hypothetical protein